MAFTPGGGLTGGGTLVTLVGSGFDALFGAVNHTLCQWGDANASTGAPAPTVRPVLLESSRLVCAAPPHSRIHTDSLEVALSVALNAIDFANLSLAYHFYLPPEFATLSPAACSSNGGVHVTLTGVGFQAFSLASATARCRWGDTAATELLSISDTVIVCASAAFSGLANDTSAEVSLALNGVDFSSTGKSLHYLTESVARVTVGEGAAGGPLSGGTLLQLHGTSLGAVTHCMFGLNVSRATGVAVPSTASVVVCPSPPSLGLDLDQTAFDPTAGRRLQAGSLASDSRGGSVPVLLSRDGVSFFHTAQTYFYFDAPHNFTSLYPRGGTDGKPTRVTISGLGFLGFTDDVSQVRSLASRTTPTPRLSHPSPSPPPSASAPPPPANTSPHSYPCSLPHPTPPRVAGPLP